MTLLLLAACCHTVSVATLVLRATLDPAGTTVYSLGVLGVCQSVRGVVLLVYHRAGHCFAASDAARQDYAAENYSAATNGAAIPNSANRLHPNLHPFQVSSW